MYVEQHEQIVRDNAFRRREVASACVYVRMLLDVRSVAYHVVVVVCAGADR